MWAVGRLFSFVPRVYCEAADSMKPFSIYFPQFYTTQTNDAAWGKGFTDWALVADANLHGRWQRRAPARGFYDGSDPCVHRSQMQQMRDFALGGMALYHYWFYSHQELPAFEQTLLRDSSETPVPWFLIWATEGWSRRWLGDPTTIVALSKRPDLTMIEAHCDHLARCFDHPSYWRWKGRPLFIWYHLGHFENPAEVLEQYRSALARRSVEPAFGHFAKNPFDLQHSKLTELTYLFEPRLFFGMRRAGRGAGAKALFDRFERLVGAHLAARMLILIDKVQQSGTVHAADSFLQHFASNERRALVESIDTEVQEVLSPGWNNTPRYRERFTALEDVPPAAFETLVRQACGIGSAPPLINAWNEWSEGAAIEPCAYYGVRYLDAVRAAGAAPPMIDECAALPWSRA